MIHLMAALFKHVFLILYRKVLKCFRNQSSPVVVHCSGGIDRTGTYILIDMVLGKMTRGITLVVLYKVIKHETMILFYLLQ